MEKFSGLLSCETNSLFLNTTTRTLLFCCILFVGCGPQNNYSQSKNFGVRANSAMVVSAHHLASQVGVDIMKQGGNAIDAAIAVHFVLAVVYPNAGNIGGGGFMVIRLQNGKKAALDFREKAPLAANKDMFLDEEKMLIPNLSLNSHLAAGVPGSVDGMFKAYEQYATLDFKTLIQPSIELAENGFELSISEADRLNNLKQVFIERNPNTDYFIKENLWSEGDLFVQKDLAITLKLIRDNGRDGFYKGITAENIIKEIASGNGIITQEDLDLYQSVWRTPIEGRYKNYNIISMGPPSSGGIALIQLLKIIEDFPIANYGWNSTQTAHLMIEAERRVFADRAEHLGDMDFYEVPVEGLLTNDYLSSRFADFNPERATKSSKIKAGMPIALGSEETTHFSIVDSHGNAVAVTTTLNGPYGSKIFVSGSGFLLNNEMDDFSAKPGSPNLYGLVGGQANAIQPQKRMLSSMTPTIIEQNKGLFMVLGTPGGSTIITSVFQTFLNVVEHNMTMQEAVDASRFHHQWLPDKVFYESNAFEESVISELASKGHPLEARENIGRVDAILVRDDYTLEGGADQRGEDTAVGF